MNNVGILNFYGFCFTEWSWNHQVLEEGHWMLSLELGYPCFVLLEKRLRLHCCCYIVLLYHLLSFLDPVGGLKLNLLPLFSSISYYFIIDDVCWHYYYFSTPCSLASCSCMLCFTLGLLEEGRHRHKDAFLFLFFYSTWVCGKHSILVSRFNGLG